MTERVSPAQPREAAGVAARFGESIGQAPFNAGLGSGRRAATLALLAFAMLIVSLDQYIVVVALPAIGHDLGFSDQTLQAVISAYAVTSAGFLLLGGRAADVLGRRRILVSGLALYAAASLAGGLAAAPAFLVVARALQGLGGAFVFPATLSLVNTTFAEGRERNRAVAVWGAAGAAGLVVGVLLGGVLTQTFGWEAVFFVNVPLVGVALLLAFALIPADRDRDPGRTLDLPGALSATLGVTLLVFALVEGPNLGWVSPAVLASAGASLALLVALASIERRSRDPLFSSRLLTNRNLGTAVVIAFLFWATFGSVLYLLTIYLQDVHGYDPWKPASGSCSRQPSWSQPRRWPDRWQHDVVCGRPSSSRSPSELSGRDARSHDVRRRLLRCPDPRTDRTQHRRRHRLHRDVHRRRDRSVGRGTGRRVRHCLHKHLDWRGRWLAVLVLVASSGTDGLSGEELRRATADGLQVAMLVIAAVIAATALVALNLRPGLTPRGDTEGVNTPRCGRWSS
jgi:MFS family permease